MEKKRESSTSDLSNKIDDIVVPIPNISKPFIPEEPKYFSDIFTKSSKSKIKKTIITGPRISFSDFPDFGYISFIKISSIQNESLEPNTEIETRVGGAYLHSEIVGTDTSTNYYIFSLDFPTSHFYTYHTFELEITKSNFSMFKMEINGYMFDNQCKSQYPLIVDHDPKYYDKTTGYEWRFMNGVAGCSISRSKILSEQNKKKSFNKSFNDYMNEGVVTVKTQKYAYPETIEFTGLDIANTGNFTDNPLEILSNYKKFTKNTYDFIVFNSIYNLKFNFIEENEQTNKCVIYYTIERNSDAISRIQLPRDLVNKITLDTNVKISLYNSHEIMLFGTFDSQTHLGSLENFYYLINKQYIDTYLLVEVPSSDIYKWLQIDVIFGSVYFENNPRRHLAQNTDPKYLHLHP